MSFVKELRHLLPSKFENHRPFVCDGWPQTCEVMVIGENPARPLHTDWWTFWSDTTGFSRDRFDDVYGEDASATRRKLNVLSGLVRSLETNVFSNERPGGAGPNPTLNIEVIALLLRYMPRCNMVVGYGAVASSYLEHLPVPDSMKRHYLKNARHVSYTDMRTIAAMVRQSGATLNGPLPSPESDLGHKEARPMPKKLLFPNELHDQLRSGWVMRTPTIREALGKDRGIAAALKQQARSTGYVVERLNYAKQGEVAYRFRPWRDGEDRSKVYDVPE